MLKARQHLTNHPAGSRVRCTFLLYWLIASRNSKKEIYRQSFLSSTVISAGFLLGAALLFMRQLSIGWLDFPLLPQNLLTGLVGTLVCAAGLGLALWARHTLGANWSGVVSLKES